jgi:diguanylate cyclase (GGDEF)-like protein
MRSRNVSMIAMIAGLCLFPAGIGAAMGQHGESKAALVSSLSRAAAQQAEILDDYFSRARSINLLVARNPAFRHFYELPGTRQAKLRADSPVVEEVNAGLLDVDDLFRDSISEACFIDRSGAEVARVVRRQRAAIDDLSLDESQNPFFAKAFATKPGQVYQSTPYVSADTGDWVIANATPLAGDGVPSGRPNQAIVHFEVSLDSFRRATTSSNLFDVAVVDAGSRAVLIDSRYAQVAGAPLGRPQDARFRPTVLTGTSGSATIGGRPAAFVRITPAAGNANDWYAFATSRSAVGHLYGIRPWTLWLSGAALAFLVLGAISGQLAHRQLLASATTDSLTTLGNRRALLRDIPVMIGAATPARPLLVMMFDLNGFKVYNDQFGHPAGDALLHRLGSALRRAMSGRARAYRPGGDEFCVLALLPGPDAAGPIQDAAAAALTEHGAGFAIDASCGALLLPQEATTAEEALRAADQRMYANKRSGRRSADQQSKDVLIRALHERRPELADRRQALRTLVEAVTHALPLNVAERRSTIQAAELYDIGTVAIPDAILNDSGVLTEDERAFLARHVEISERIISAAPALTQEARLVRGTEEWFDGSGHPDHFQGDQIPLGSRILAVCIAYVTLTHRPGPELAPDQALTELHRQAGTRFDPDIVRTATDVVLKDGGSADRGREDELSASGDATSPSHIL